MKLRNKKTGEIIDKICIHVCSFDVYGNECKEICTETRSLEKVLETWEDYKPKEPLIKDKKIRKAVRAWAEACGIETTGIKVLRGIIYTTIIGWKGTRQLSMDFENSMLEELKDGEDYTITELCGEEEK